MKTRRVKLWGGTLVIKHRERLNFQERHGRVPVFAFGSRRIIWWSNEALTTKKNPSKESNGREPG